MPENPFARGTKRRAVLALLALAEGRTVTVDHLTEALWPSEPPESARQALHYEAELNKALGEPLDTRLDSTTRRIQSAGDKLVEALLFVDEARLTAPIRGTSGYAEEFQTRGPTDSAGRSLRKPGRSGTIVSSCCGSEGSTLIRS